MQSVINKNITSIDLDVRSIVATAGQTLTIAASNAHSILMSFTGSNSARSGLYSLISWAGTAEGKEITAIRAVGSGGVTITATTTGWTVATGTGTRTFKFVVLGGTIDGLSVS